MDKYQEEAAACLSGIVRIIACPGSGKTTTILARANNIIRSGIKPNEICIISFSRQSAEDLKDRYRQKYDTAPPVISTIHSLCYQIVLESGRIKKKNSIIGDYEKRAIVEECLASIRYIDPMKKMEIIKSCIENIAYVKITETDIRAFNPDKLDNPDFRRLYSMYHKKMEMEEKIDFEDMIIMARDILRTDEQALNHYASKFKYMMVDEFQDTDRMQYQVICLLTSVHKNLCVVGDIDQSIYRFRGANPSIMLNMDKDFPECKDFRLSINYRSKENIITAASALIKNNKDRFDIDFIASRKETAEIRCETCDSSITQCDFIIKELKNKIENGEKPDDMAVLYRTNNQNQMIAGKLFKEEIPFYTTETLKDYHQDVVFMDIVAYYRLSRGNSSTSNYTRHALRRPETYFPSKLVSHKKNVSIDELLELCSDLPNSRASSTREKLFRMKFYIDELGKRSTPLQFIEYMEKRMDYRAALKQYAENMGRDESELEEILDILKEEAESFQTMEAWIEYAKQYAVLLKEQNEKREGVCLSTYHSSKGLEWKNVFLMDVNDGCTPFCKAETPEELEEERRMFYVALTRAKDNLYISYIKKGKKKNESPYIKEMNLKPESEFTKKKDKNYTRSPDAVTKDIFKEHEKFLHKTNAF